MPYTKEELDSNEHYQDIISANRRSYDEQVEREFVAMRATGSRANSTPTLRNEDGSIILYEDPDDGSGLNRPNQFVAVEATQPAIRKKLLNSVVDRTITELSVNIDEGSGLSIEELFAEYDRLKDDISPTGTLLSHSYLIEVSRTYVSGEDPEIVALKEALATQIMQLQDAQTALQEVQQQLQAELANAQAAATVGTTTTTTTTVPATDQEAYTTYVTEMEGYANTKRPYTYDEWVQFDKPAASAGWDKLLIIDHPHEMIDDPYTHTFSSTRDKIHEIIRVAAQGDDSLTYLWHWKASGEQGDYQIFTPISEQYEQMALSDGENAGLDLDGASIIDATHHRSGFGFMLLDGITMENFYVKCKVSDRSGEAWSDTVEFRITPSAQATSTAGAAAQDRGGGSGCFVGGTQIQMNEGVKFIEDIKVGDVVKSFDVGISSIIDSEVTKTYVHSDRYYMILNGTIKTTSIHPFYTDGKWVEAGDLSVGNKILHVDGLEHTIETIELSDESVIVYNLEVDGTHNYFAEGYLVHNK
jgi:hypothetical protein